MVIEKNLDSDLYSDDEIIEDDFDEDDGCIRLSIRNMSEKEMLEEENMAFEEIEKKYKPYYEKAKKAGISHYVIDHQKEMLEDEDDYDDPFHEELDVFRDEYQTVLTKQ